MAEEPARRITEHDLQPVDLGYDEISFGPDFSWLFQPFYRLFRRGGRRERP